MPWHDGVACAENALHRTGPAERQRMMLRILSADAQPETEPV
ncbi:hypothetical protein [Streptomyces sp. GC420]|nr:hypothetical protein [Streptomyces sp. GC420]